MLAFLLFIHHAYIYTKQEMRIQLHLFSDSESLMDKVVDMLKWTSYYPSATLKADWDILQAIVYILRLFDKPPVIKHVTGYQDDDTDYTNLPLEEKLNVKADRLAGLFRYCHESDTICPIIKGSVATLVSKHQTIASRYHQNIRKMLSEQATKCYICDKNNWDYQFDLVDWNSHGISVWSKYNIKHFMVKYINNWLPVGALVSKYAKHYPPGCPLCDCEFETRKHMLQCPARRIQRQKLVTNLKRFMNYFPTDSMLKFMLL